ncbi:BspA family leucine-rich repeat surface protein [Campylobacter jejuni]|nr:BspA family leucine-rich repeat surface protein [Campylobacter jejuni]ELN4931479.1 BspA family leucine-rich repeat surface protein [Campylobacter jejuni]
MFWGCENFNQDISAWNTSSVENMSCMFLGCRNFNQPLNGWDVGNVEYRMVCFMKVEWSGMILKNQDLKRSKNEIIHE